MSDLLFHLEVVTPSSRVFSGEVSQVSLAGVKGQMCILANHAPLLALLQPGLIVFKEDNDEQMLAAAGGFVQVQDNNVSVLVDRVWRKEDLPEELSMDEKPADLDKRYEAELLYAAKVKLKAGV
ncbi:TPA: ATP synthase F1 subunit epsilon [bacterium UBP9_UBA11836]|nr:ATP synthase F1 subunit epsilon [bacterium UBP9_UBA11836]